MRAVCQVICRILLSAWVGAATLFVIVSVREVRTPEFDSMVRDLLVLRRFPAFYAVGFLMLAGAVLATWGGWSGRLYRRAWILRGLTGAAVLTMLVDYVWIYRSLEQMIDPPGKVRPAAFTWYHHASETINAAGLLFTLAAAVVACWPTGGVRHESPAARSPSAGSGDQKGSG